MLLPSCEETRIDIEFADGQESLVLDATDLDNLVKDVWTNKIPEDSTFEHEYARLFKQKYHRVISRTAANLLVGKRRDVLESVKKKLYQPVEPSDTSEPEPISPTENSDSSPTSKT